MYVCGVMAAIRWSTIRVIDWYVFDSILVMIRLNEKRLLFAPICDGRSSVVVELHVDLIFHQLDLRVVC